MSDIIRELGVLVNRGQREKIDAFVEANREEVISAARNKSDVICRWIALCAFVPRDEYGRMTEEPTPESEIRVFHAANGKKIVDEVDRLKSLDLDTRMGYHEAFHVAAWDAINNSSKEEA